MVHDKAKITLVGAGPGGADLISLRGIRALESAQVVLYDALVNETLLDYATQAVYKIYVGKRAGQRAYPQDHINRMLVEYACSYGHVVRLKGGDPFVFGRGYEEMAYVQSHGLEVELVPGISSAVGVPALQGIPVTHRGVTESFWVITGTTVSGALSKDVVLAAQTRATVVILMGVDKLSEIVRVFQQAGQGSTPIAIIQNGTLPDERMVSADVDHIVDKIRLCPIGSPAVIVIGQVVALQKLYTSYPLTYEYASS